MDPIRRVFFLLLLVSGLGLFGCHKSEGFRFQVAFPDTQGLKNGAPVFYRGVEVGKVERVSLQPSSVKNTTEVAVDIILTDPNAQVRQSDIIRATAFSLLGDKIVEIVPGTATSPLIANGARLNGEIQPPLEGVNTFMELTGLTVKLNSLPQKKKDELLKKFHNLVDQATDQLKTGTQQTSSTER